MEGLRIVGSVLDEVAQPWWDDEQHAAWEARRASAKMIEAAGIDLPDNDVRRAIQKQIEEQMAKARVSLPNTGIGGILSPDTWGSPASNPMQDIKDYLEKIRGHVEPRSAAPFDESKEDYTQPRQVCVWCGVEDRAEFFKETKSWANDAIYPECKDEQGCQMRVVDGGGKHQ